MPLLGKAPADIDAAVAQSLGKLLTEKIRGKPTEEADRSAHAPECDGNVEDGTAVERLKGRFPLCTVCGQEIYKGFTAAQDHRLALPTNASMAPFVPCSHKAVRAVENAFLKAGLLTVGPNTSSMARNAVGSDFA